MSKFFTWYLDHPRFLGLLWGMLAILLVVLTKSWIALVGTLVCCIIFFLGCDYLGSNYAKARDKKFMEATEPTHRWVYMDDRAVRLPRDSGSQTKKEEG
jgi:hypothetical protein